MEIIRIPVLSDNYIFVLYDPDEAEAVVVDPAVPQPVLDWLGDNDAQLTAIWNTHHHSDHVGANRKLIEKFPGLEVIAGQYDFEHRRIPGQTQVVSEGDRVQFSGREAVVIDCPGHTLGHIAYYFPPTSEDPEPQLFCGDTVFAGGCGRLFEGTAAQMVSSIDKFRRLPTNTQIWCAHEYTLNNLKFALAVEPDNQVLQQRMDSVRQLRQNSQATVPSNLEMELATNPFLRWDQPSISSRFGSSPEEVFATVRKKKDRF